MPAGTSSSKRSGYILAGVFVLLSAARDLWGYLTLLGAPVHATLFASFAATVLIAQLWNRLHGEGRTLIKGSPGLLKDTVLLNITTLISWIATFEGLARLLPTTLAAITVGGIPLSTLLLDRFLRRKAISMRSFANAALIISGMLVMSWRELGLDAPGHTRMSIGIGIGFSAVAAVFAAANNVFAKRINDRGFTGTEVFASRFWLLLGICVVWCIVGRSTLPSGTMQWLRLTSLGVVGIALPVICLQMSIERIGPRIVGFLIAAIPVLVAIAEIVLRRYLDRTGTVSILLGVGVILVVSGIVRELAPSPSKKG